MCCDGIGVFSFILYGETLLGGFERSCAGEQMDCILSLLSREKNSF